MNRLVSPIRRQTRRRFLGDSLALASFGLVSGCGLLPTQLQPTARASRLGYLSLSIEHPERTEAFRQGLRDLGWVDGQNITTEFRFAKALDELPELMAELVALKSDVIVAVGTPAILVAKQGTSTIPIVMGVSGDPVGIGFVDSLARPGGNLTGLSSLAPQVSGRRLQLFNEAAPAVTRVAFFWNPAVPDKTQEVKELQAVAPLLGIEVQAFAARTPDELEASFVAARTWGADGVGTLMDALTDPYDHSQRIANFGLQNRVPSVCELRGFVGQGGLMSYGPNPIDLYRRAAGYVDRILKGAKPADLPIEQPTTFELVINLKTAQAIGLTIPKSVLEQASLLVE
jgi:putative tryptophan/tyrosine transport system substrate-binding protein